MRYTDQAGRVINLDRKLGAGGEAEIFSVTGQSDVVAKIYFTQSVERTTKLQAMVSSPPADPTRSQGHVSICWPKALIFLNSQICAGFLMQSVDYSTNVPVFQLYNPHDRQVVAPGFNWGYLLRTAANIASVVEAIHACGCVVGDINESNFLVSERALVTLVDCDSIQVPRLAGRGFYRCPVGKPDFTPPELQGLDFGQVDRDRTHDNFALGVIVFQLLMEGVHPYSGVWRGKGDPPVLEDRIRAGYCTYAGSALVSPMPAAISFNILPLAVKALFGRCFGYGHNTPSIRPSAREWRDALSALERNLNTCSGNRRHVYANHLPNCPWCERRILLNGLDPFPPDPNQRPLATISFAARKPPTTARMPQPQLSPRPVTLPQVAIPNTTVLSTLQRTISLLSQPSLHNRKYVAAAVCLVVVIFFWILRRGNHEPPSVQLSGNQHVISLGEATTLHWSAKRADRVSIEPGLGEVSVEGDRLVSPSATTQYTVTADGPGGRVTSQFTVQVVSMRPKILTGKSTTAHPVITSFNANPAVIEAGDSTTLRWTVTGSSAVQVIPGIGYLPPVGEKVISPVTTTTYTLQMQGAGGSTKAYASVHVNAPKKQADNPLEGSARATPSIVAFEAVPTSVAQCTVSILRWTVTNASTVSISPEIGTVEPRDGYRVVRPLQTTLYTLRAVGPGGSVTRGISLSVIAGTRTSCIQ